MITQLEFNATKQNNRELHYKINLLNYKFQLMDELSGVALNMSFSLDANSDIRRIGSISISPNDPNAFKMQAGSKIWLDKYVQVFVGIKEQRTQEIVYTNMGIYMVNNPSQNFSSTDDTITIGLLDLMAKLTGERNGNLDGYDNPTYHIDAGENIRDVMITVLQECGFTKYSINILPEDYQTTQIEINVDNTQSWYKVLSELDYVNTNYQMYFDLDGVFHYERIPSGKNEQVMVNDEIWKECFISYNKSNSYSDIKNHVVVIGKTHEISHFSSSVTKNTSTVTATDETSITVNQYSMSISSVTSYWDSLKIGFVSPSSLISSNAFINVNGLGAKPILNRKHEWDNDINTSGVYYVAQLQEVDTPISLSIGGKTYQTTSYWEFLGEVTPSGYAKEENPESPFYVNGTMGDVVITLSGGEYDNITTSDLATQRAQWELYNRCRLQDNIQLTCVPIYWMDVNWVIEITLPDESEPQKFIVKQVSTDCAVGGVQTITAMKYYSFYE